MFSLNKVFLARLPEWKVMHQISMQFNMMGSMMTHDGVHVVQQVGGLFHGRGHEVLELLLREPFHYMKPHVLPHDQQEGDGHVVVALVVMELGVPDQHPDY